MKLTKLLERLEYTIVSGPEEQNITNITNDSRKAEKGSLFFCIKGAVTDGHAFARVAAEKGAAALITEESVEVPAHVTVVRVKDTRYAMAVAAAAWYGYPADTLRIIGVTGTKGKTTTTYMIRAILEKAGYKTGLIGTIETVFGDTHIPSDNTTPESLLIQGYFARMLEEGCQACVMEVSSQALKLDRTAGVMFEYGVFTNLSPDHIGPNEHTSFEEYMECKSRLFRQCRHGIFNCDDEHLEGILEGHTCTVETFGCSEKADLRASHEKLTQGPGWLGVEYDITGETELHVKLDMPGLFNVYNSLAAIAVCRHFDVTDEDIEETLSTFRVKGRIEMVKVSDDFTLMIDYAHNAVALESLLETLREYHPKRLVTLFGCGGNRSKLRRFEMGEVSGRMSDLTVITSDNPRYEKPEDIIADIETGIRKTEGKFVTIPDRREAIAWVIHNAEPGDVVVLAGKGHEDYQEIRGVKYPMDEREIIADILKKDAEQAFQG